MFLRYFMLQIAYATEHQGLLPTLNVIGHNWEEIMISTCVYQRLCQTVETICHPLFLSRLTPSHNSSLAPPPSLDLLTHLTQRTMEQTTRRLLIVGLIVFRWAWGSILYQTEVNGTDQINGRSLPTVVIPLSPSCNVSRTAVVDELVGEYNVPSTGEYWLEIIGILCNDLIWDEDYRNVCLEDPAYMQITDVLPPLMQQRQIVLKAIGLDTGNGLVTNQAYHYTHDISPQDADKIRQKNVKCQCHWIGSILINSNFHITTKLLE
eukprot:scaffold749_cov193-Alexandrium_tamarense.AAC.1